MVTVNVADFHELAHASELHCGIVVVLEGSLPRAEQLALLHKVVDVIESEVVAGRDLVNRVLRMSADGTAELIELPDRKQ